MSVPNYPPRALPDYPTSTTTTTITTTSTTTTDDADDDTDDDDSLDDDSLDDDTDECVYWIFGSIYTEPLKKWDTF
jgi:hypothetical protein